MLVFEILKLNMNGSKLIEIIKYGLVASIVSLGVSVPIDTFFWGLQYDIRYRTDPKKLFAMWPEMHSFYFNGV